MRKLGLQIVTVSALIAWAVVLGATQSKTSQTEFKEVDTAAGKMRLVVTPETPESRARAQAEELRNAYNNAYNNVSIEKFNWEKGGFDTVMIANFDLRNKNDFDVKDITVSCFLYAPSGTLIDTTRRTVYELIKPNSKKRITKFNMGFAHTQAKSARCEVSAARV